MKEGINLKLGAIVLDSGNSEELSAFYEKLLGWTKHRYDEEWIIVSSGGGEGTPLVFQEVKNYERPVWPGVSGKQQQMLHLDFYVDDIEKGVRRALSCGAELSKIQLEDGWRVLLDQAGHPFCILPNMPPVIAQP